MKFAFKILWICVNFSIGYGQFWNNLFPGSYPNTYQNSYQYQNSYPNTYQNTYPSRNGENSISPDADPPMSLSLNSCENYWTIENDVNGVWGHLSITSPNKEQAIIKVVLTLAAALPTRYVGDIDLLKSKQSTSADVANGLPIEYQIRFPLQNPIPKLTEIYYNNQLLCRGQKAVGLTLTTITLDHSFYTGLSNNVYYGGQNTYPVRTTQRPITQSVITQPPQTYRPATYQTVSSRPYSQKTTKQPTIATRPTERPTSIDEKISILSSQCGEPKVNFRNVTSLIVNGKLALKGQFPWLAAYYHNDEGFNGFICGGSLVSQKIVITAAHCINDKSDPSFVRRPDQAIIYLGRHNLRNEAERGFLFSGAIKFVMHPDWKPKVDSYDGDIAAIVLLRTIEFTALVQPICLWDSTSSYTDIIDHKGIVAGYGKTQTSIAESNVPYWSELPVVDERTCFDSNNIFLQLTSRRTFCGGNRDGTGPCNGDSGGAFTVQSGNKYYLRGIVSAALLNREKFICDTNNYAVFTDVAAFTSWIYTQIETYG